MYVVAAANILFKCDPLEMTSYNKVNGVYGDIGIHIGDIEFAHLVDIGLVVIADYQTFNDFNMLALTGEEHIVG